MTDQNYYDMWKMGRTRLTNQLDKISEEDLLKRVQSESNSVGWLLRHIVEVELLFAKNVFEQDLNVKAQTIGSIAKDRGQFKELEPLLELIERAEEELGSAIQKIEEWDGEVTTAEFGTVTRAEALGRITTHTAYHAGQIALAKKYGEPRK
ncbi:damage-inducible protein DinB [Rhodohalobacter barkolensis]|uniref:Damage-inducible protein DinB n=2 Tax=Rhodohalobacter barkolensis TaxID=2053187 RepID=A0A2N0VML3_9BACT|nr:damage-inducible protein DinB [Rhodohalobacter barkolensis]